MEMEYDYNIIIPVTVTADYKDAAEEAIIKNLAEFVPENKERITLKYIRVKKRSWQKVIGKEAITGLLNF